MKILKTAKYREQFRDKGMTFCSSCEEAVPLYQCPLCNSPIKGSCRECHDEIVHNRVENSNVETFRNDAFKYMEPRMRSKMRS